MSGDFQRATVNIKSTIYQYAPPPPVDPETLADAQARLETLPLDEVPPIAPLPSGSRMPYTPNPLFVGREEDFKTLARALKGGGTAAVSQAAGVTGMGGVGKTQLAVEFAHRYGGYFAGGVFWLSFGDPAAVPAEVASCGGPGGLDLRPDFPTLPLDDQVRLVRAAWSSPLPRLLIFDNCEDQDLLAQWRPATGGCRVLVTSRRAGWDAALGVQPLPLGVLARDESLALLRKFRSDLAEAEANAIAAELGDLPLALHLAGSFLRQYRHAAFGVPAAYLAQLRDTAVLEHLSLAGEGAGYSPTGHELHVARTFARSYQRLDPAEATDTLALGLLARAAHFAPGEPIPRALLLLTAGIKPDDFEGSLAGERALARLGELGLLEEVAEGSLRLHRLLARFVRSAADDLYAPAQAAVEEALLAEANRLNHVGYPGPLLAWQAHLRAVTDTAQQRGDERAASLCNELGYHLQALGDYAGARPYYERALRIREQVLGPEHPITATSLNNLGVLLDDTGDYPAARPYLERALRIREQVLGGEHPATATSFNNLGMLLKAMGELAGARPYYERALRIREQALGPQHPDTTLSLNNLGSLLQAMGDLAGARPYLEQALRILEDVLGAEHPDTAQSLNNLGGLLQAMGNYAEARLYYERALRIYEQVLGAQHPYTATSLNNLGYLLQLMGDLAGARPYLERALRIHEQVLGAEHPVTATSLSSLGLLLNALGDLAGARPYLERALRIYEQVLGAEHPVTAASLNNVGGLLRAMGDYAGACPYLERALRIHEQVLGAEHPDTALSLNNLGMLLKEMGDLVGARPNLERALGIRQQVLGADHPDTANSLNNLGTLLQAMGDYAGARPYYERALRICEARLGAEHPTTRLVRRNLAALDARG